MGQNSFDGDGLHQRNQLQVPLHPRQIESQQILLGPDSGPAAQLVQRDNAVGLHFDFLDGKCFVSIDQTVERPITGAVEQVQPKASREDSPHADRGQARPRGANLAGAQFHVQHLLASQSPILWFTLKPHSSFG